MAEKTTNLVSYYNFAIILVAVPFLFIGGFWRMNGLIDVLTSLMCLRFVDIRYPLNLLSFLEGFEVFRFQWFPNFFDLVFDLGNRLDDQGVPLPFKRKEITSNYLINVGSVISLFIVLGFLYGALKVVRKLIWN